MGPLGQLPTLASHLGELGAAPSLDTPGLAPEGVWFLVGRQAGSRAPPCPSWLLTAPVLSGLPGPVLTVWPEDHQWLGSAALHTCLRPPETESKARFGGFP